MTTPRNPISPNFVKISRGKCEVSSHLRACGAISARANSDASLRTSFPCPRTLLIVPPLPASDLDASVVGLQDLDVRRPAAGEAVRPVLTHADAMPPPAPEEAQCRLAGVSGRRHDELDLPDTLFVVSPSRNAGKPALRFLGR